MQSYTNKDKNKNKIMFFCLDFIFIFEVRAFIVMVLKILAFSNSKSYFIYFTTSLCNTPNIKYSIFFITSFKIMRKRENMSFLIEGRDIILIKYCILFLTTCYIQLVYIPVYCSCKKFSISFSNNT